MGWNPEGGQPEGWQPDGWQPPTPTEAPTPVMRSRFYIRAPRERFTLSLMNKPDFRFDTVIKDPDESYPVELNLYAACVNARPPNELVATGEHCRPPIPNGFAYEATTGGLTAAREPRWPTTVAQTVQDGSVVWTCRAAASLGINAVSSPTATSDPTGLTIDNVAVSEDWKIVATYEDGVEGSSYDVVYAFTLNGLPRVARQRVEVRKQ